MHLRFWTSVSSRSLVNEHGVQGRLSDRIGHIMTIIAKAQQLSLEFGDFQAANMPPYTKTPDHIIMDLGGKLLVVVEVKIAES